MTVIVGMLADELGHTARWETVAAPLSTGRNFDVERRFAAVPSTEYRSVQAAEIRVDINHEPGCVIGEVKFLKLNAGRLHAVCEIDGSALGEGPWYFSPEVIHRGGRDIELRALAVTKRPASVCLGPLQARAGTLHDAASHVVHQDGHIGELIKAADEYQRRRKRGEPLHIHGTTTPRRPADIPMPVDHRHLGAVEYRSAQTVDVNPRARLIELVACPYGTEAIVAIRGRMVAESFVNTAFAADQPKRIVANRDHDSQRIFGKVTTLEPFHADGLHAVIQASATPLGLETVELCRDDVVAPSVGFQIPTRDGEVWEGSARRRVVKALLREISLVPQPAYPTRVLDVRTHT